MEVQQLDNENHEPIACTLCTGVEFRAFASIFAPRLSSAHRATHSVTTTRQDFSKRSEYGCAAAVACVLGLPLWQQMPIDVFDKDELAHLARRPRRHATEHQLTETELRLVRYPSPAGEVTRRASPVERLAASLHGLVTGHADPTPAELAILIRRAIEDATAQAPTKGAVCE